MGILSRLFSRNSTPKITTYADFWTWFNKNERDFFKVVKEGTDIDKQFFIKLSPMLEQLHSDIFFLVGMCDEQTAELVLSADGVLKKIPFIEELVGVAPDIPGWRFRSLKPPMDIEGFGVNMAGNSFSSENLFFYANEHYNTPDQIDLVIVHKDFVESDRLNFINGIYIFLDNYLGELNMVTMIDNLTFADPAGAEAELIPIFKLKDYLNWREKEFVEKYGDLRHLSNEDGYNSIEATLDNGKPLLAIANSSLLNWDGKASHAWVMAIEIKYSGEENNGMPDQIMYEKMDQFEDQLMLELNPKDGYLNVGRQTGDGLRIVYFACTEFRKPVLVMEKKLEIYKDSLNISYSIYKDKYWETFEWFIATNAKSI